MASPFDGTVSRIFLVIALLAVPLVVVRVLVIQPFSIPSGSMMPTLEVGDHMLATKFSYGLKKFALPAGRFLPEFTIAETPPWRGDVVVFKLPANTSVDYVKRVIGLPGETVQVIDGIVRINGVPLRQEPAGTYDTANPEMADYRDAPLLREFTPEGSSHEVLDLGLSEGDNTSVFNIPDGHYFVMGDNRDNTSDSRFGVGFVPEANIYAKPILVVTGSDGRSLLRSVDSR